MLKRLFFFLLAFVLLTGNAWAVFAPYQNAANQLIEVHTAETLTKFIYDPLGRRIVKHSEPKVPDLADAGRQWRQQEIGKQTKARGLGTTFYGWDGDTLAWETGDEESTHYFYEPDSFIPLAQCVQNHAMELHKTPDWTDKPYALKEDPLWTEVFEPSPFDRISFYHCDHLGTPQELTDEAGNIAWQAQYKAWGEAKIRTGKEGGTTYGGSATKNPIRFQGQYFDHETGLHYNRFRYYDPETGRFISRDPIKYAGGLNLHVYAPSPVQWIDPLGLNTKGCGAVHSRYPDGTPVMEGEQPGKIKGPTSNNSHTVLQWDEKNGRVYKTREYAGNGVPVRDIDFTHPTYPNGTLRPDHTAPEQHRYTPNDPNNPKAGYKRGKGEPLVML